MALVGALLFSLVGDVWGYKRSVSETGDPIKWDRRCIAYHVYDEGSEDIAFGALVEAIQKSFLTWQGVMCSSQYFHYSGITDDSLVGYRLGGPNLNTIIFQEEGDKWEHPRDVVALTTVTFCREVGGACTFVGEILDADVEFNGAYLRFSTTDPAPLTRFDVENTLTHELGHLLGLDHSTVAVATMYASAPPGETIKRDLDEDDIAAICDVYPSVSPVPECEPFDVDGDATGGYAPTIEDDDVVGCDGCVTNTSTGSALWLLVFLLFGLIRGARRGSGRCSSR
jgi:hypothetical protein